MIINNYQTTPTFYFELKQQHIWHHLTDWSFSREVKIGVAFKISGKSTIPPFSLNCEAVNVAIV